MCTASIRALMMEAVRISETSINFNVTTRRYIPEDSKLHTRYRENLKSHVLQFLQKRDSDACTTDNLTFKELYITERVEPKSVPSGNFIYHIL
jgi:hypothetical protein